MSNPATQPPALLDTDLLCWQCQYNLRTLATNAACPECGYPVEKSIQYSSGAKARRFSLYTLSPASRTLGIILGLIVPVGVILLAALTPMKPLMVEWQSGQWYDYVGTMLAGRSMWAFYPFLLWGFAAFSALLIAPLPMGRKWWVRAGLWVGIIMGVQYQLTVFFSMQPISHNASVLAVFLGIFPPGIVLATAFRQDNTNKPQPSRKQRTQTATIAQTLGVIAGFLALSFGTMGIALLIALLTAPYLMLMSFLPALCRLYRTEFDEPREPARSIPLTATAAGYVAAWPIAITQAQAVYASLPTQPPGCYICTASARGHRLLTRPTTVVYPTGQTLLVTRQMRVLKAAELELARLTPPLHRRLRRIYDAVGPRIAQRIQSPWLADASYLLFAVPALLAEAALRITARADQIDETYTRA